MRGKKEQLKMKNPQSEPSTPSSKFAMVCEGLVGGNCPWPIHRTVAFPVKEQS